MNVDVRVLVTNLPNRDMHTKTHTNLYTRGAGLFLHYDKFIGMQINNHNNSYNNHNKHNLNSIQAVNSFTHCVLNSRLDKVKKVKSTKMIM